MRKCLNILQASHASSSSSTIDEEIVYRCTGNPLPSDINTIMMKLTNRPFKEAYERTF